MSKIKELLNDKDTVIAFDVDRVLAVLEFGEYSHFTLHDDEWVDAVNNGTGLYDDDKVSLKMQNYLKTRDMNNIYVITRSSGSKEDNVKRDYLMRNYNILSNNIYYVRGELEKKDKLNEIKNKYPDLEDYKLLMVDDTINVLNDIKDNTNYSTVHISSFLDL